ncbi:AzlC family ABC transporter permease [Sneathiella chinensis]|uniref:Branched-chain amino acid ABC transporter permease n=1 Tax=Sneathiella chinensis TaxID=349750 RepID=A0ABQ5U5X6_9PROT|nr:AzlC family ABC transporter permease [Sneathiella chinensis]GLQ07562.1 branched-chain amino acid ABC transporter permease [Sneathiella chinensis]
MSSSSPGLNTASFTAEGVLKGARTLFPFAIFLTPVGIAFGAAATETGLPPLQALLTSGTVFAGAAQFAALDLWQVPLPYLSIALVVLAVNARMIILGAALSPWINALPVHKRVLAILLLTDANFADSYAFLKRGGLDVGRLLGGGIIIWIMWMAGTTAGIFSGSLIGNPQTYGIDVVMVSFFAAFLIGDLRSGSSIFPIIVSCIVAIATLDVLPTGWNIIAAALAGGITGVIRHAR